MLPTARIATFRLVSVLGMLAGMLGAVSVHASDLPVTYNVQDKPLKAGAPAGTQLTFTLFSDAACTQQVFQTMIPVENVTLISKLKLATPKGATKSPATDQIQATLTGVTTSSNVYLTVTGTGVTPTGPTCQPQAGLVRPLANVPVGSVVIQNGGPPFAWYTNVGVTLGANCVYGSGGPILQADPAVVNELLTLDTSKTYLCTGRFGCNVTFRGDSFVFPLDVPSCSEVTCTDANYGCGGPCPSCPNGYPCTASSECMSGHCQALTPSACYGSNEVCIAAHCFDGVQDNGETDVDCGPACEIGCATGKMCNSNCDCASNNCQGGVCQ